MGPCAGAYLGIDAILLWVINVVPLRQIFKDSKGLYTFLFHKFCTVCLRSTLYATLFTTFLQMCDPFFFHFLI